jgi:2-keto-4-pentenoate hydratase/2-oxohepta-3-ene-1,7-dioic acid hydratase in catechol pathway
MRLITFTPATAPTSSSRAGALLPGDKSVLNFSVAVDASAEVPLGAWFDLADEWLPKVRQIHDAIAKNAARVEPLPRGSVLAISDVIIGPPVPRPGKIICIGLNYRDHAAESNMPVPSSPVTFSKYVTSVAGPTRPIVLPHVSQQVDYEAEMAVVIGRRAKRVPVEQAFAHVLGYMNFNDVSARDLQFADGQ